MTDYTQAFLWLASQSSRRKKVIFQSYWIHALGLERLKQKLIRTPFPSGRLTWHKVSHVFHELLGFLSFPTCKSNINLLFVVLSWLKMLNHKCFHLAFYESYKSVWTVHKITTFLKTFWCGNVIQVRMPKMNRIMPGSLTELPETSSLTWVMP